jgi:phosphoglycolate phosphatase
MTRRLFVDFDGTIVDSRVRQYQLFVELTGNTNITLGEYWNAKRDGINQKNMLSKYAKFTPDEELIFKKKWMEVIEDHSRLLYDELIDNVQAFLSESAKHFNLYLVTGRQHRDRLIDQMKQLGIDHYFSVVLNTAQRLPKEQLIRTNTFAAKGDVFIGDSGEDIFAGKQLGIFTVGVTTGAATHERLLKYEPNLIVNSLTDLDPLTLGMI